MKFLLTTYSTAFLASGGGETELVQTAELLSQGSCQADIYGIHSRPLDYYDVVMHFSVQPDGWHLFNTMVERGAKVLLWPNIWWQLPPSEEEIERIGLYVERAHRVIFKSNTERDHFAAHVAVPTGKLIVVPTCISPSFSSNPDLSLAKTVCEVENYVLCLGRIEPVKNQLNLIRALKLAGLSGLLVGGYNNQAYYQRCADEAGSNIQFLPFVKPGSQLLISLIAGSSVVAEPCLDPAGRSCLEAALARKPLVLSADDWVQEHFEDRAYTTNPLSVDDIAHALRQAILNTDNRTEQARDLVVQRHASGAAIEQFVTAMIGACDD